VWVRKSKLTVFLFEFIQRFYLSKDNGFTEENVMVMFIPNTYETYWNTSAGKFRDKMIKEYRNFWTADRVAKAKKQGLNPIEATILASIVHKESVKRKTRDPGLQAYT
jgi:UPF0755 protein